MSAFRAGARAEVDRAVAQGVRVAGRAVEMPASKDAAAKTAPTRPAKD